MKMMRITGVERGMCLVGTRTSTSTSTSARWRRTKVRSTFRRCASGTDTVEIPSSVGIVKKGALEGGVSAREMFDCLVEINKSKLKAPEDLLEILSEDDRQGSEESGCFWRLIYTVGKKEIQKPSEVSGKGGDFFPITAVQNWNKDNMGIRNGIFIGKHVFSLVFSGEFDVAKRGILYFDFDRLDIKLGPLSGGFDLPGRDAAEKSKRPFFAFLYADDEICIARGRGGGLAVWAKTDITWRFENGIYV